MSHCIECEKLVLTYVGLDEAGNERRACVHCDGAVADEIQWVSPGELEQSGYYFGSPPEKGASACSSGCGSCSPRKH